MLLAAFIETSELVALEITSPLICAFAEEALFVDSILMSDPDEIAPVV
jgi:hypothetical protein